MARPKFAPLAMAGMFAVLATGLVGVAAPARADCAADLKVIQTRYAREHDPDRRLALHKLIAKAEAARPTSETTCRNYVTRTWRLLHEPLPGATAGGPAPAGGLLRAPTEAALASPSLTGHAITAETPASPSQIEQPNTQVGQPKVQIDQATQPIIHRQ
jgi:hypothetical protein